MSDRTSNGSRPLLTTVFSLRAWMYLLIVSMGVGGMTPLAALDPKKSIDQYGHNIWLQQNGLPAHAINAAAQTRDGYLWFGTSAGLFRFDGVRFEEFGTDPKNDKVHESISALVVPDDSSLWIGTRYNGLRRLTHGKTSLHGVEAGFHSTQIRHLFVTKAGQLLISTSYGAFVFRDGKFNMIMRDPNFINAMVEDSKTNVWISSQDGLRMLDHGDSSRTIGVKTNINFPNISYTCLYVDREGNVWEGTTHGLVKWTNGRQVVYNTGNGLSNEYINTVFEDRHGNLWVGTQGGLNRFTRGRWTSFTEANGLTDNNVTSIVEDHEGSLWVCTWNGLNQFRDVDITVYTTKDGLASDYISSIAETGDGSIYFLSDRGASITRMKDDKLTTARSVAGPAFVSHDGSLWIGQSGLLLNVKDGRLIRYDTTTGLPNKWISAIGEDSAGLLLAVDNMGLRRFVDGHTVPYLLGNGQPYKSVEWMGSFFLEPNGTLWVGTSHGLLRMKDGKCTVFGLADGMGDDFIIALAGDQTGGLWIGSPHGGLMRYKNGKFTTYNSRSGLFTDELLCVVCDDRGNVWMSSPRGIACIAVSEFDELDAGLSSVLHPHVYTIADGMKTDECFGGWQPAGWKAHDGRLWFATKKGAVMIDPRTLKQNKLIPPVLVEEVIADNRALPLDRTTVLSAGTEKYEFHFTALSYLVADRVLFKYKLEGYDKEWVDAGTRRVAYYTNLSPGRYRFHVVACNNDGVWNEAGANFVFELEPHFYQSWWFYAVVLIAFVGVLFSAYRWRIWRLLKKERELNLRIQEATANIRTLGRLLPICSSCKKIRDDKGYWDRLEGYVQNHSDAIFSHGVCPECAEELYGEYYMRIKKKREADTAGVSPESTQEQDPL
jgi:ligand-binding sensor domain-containing protein